MHIYLKGCYTVLGKIECRDKGKRFCFVVAVKDEPNVTVYITPDDGTAPPVGVTLLTFEEFQEVALKLRQMVMEGAVVPEGEDKIPKLIYTLASG